MLVSKLFRSRSKRLSERRQRNWKRRRLSALLLSSGHILGLERLESRVMLDAQGFDFIGELEVRHPSTPSYSHSFSVAAADLNGNGRTDIINNENGNVTVRFNQNDGVFANPISVLNYSIFGNSVEVVAVAAADIDGDGHVDLIVANSDESVSVLRNIGDGTFAAPVGYAVERRIYSMIAVDYDGDGHVDLVTTNSPNTVSLLRNQGDGTFAAPLRYAVGGYPTSIAAADIIGNSHMDLVVTNFEGTITVLRNIGDGRFIPNTYDVGASGYYEVTTADIDGDGYIDVITVSGSDDTISVLRNSGAGTLLPPVIYNVGVHLGSIVAADLDGNGNVDLIAADTINSNLNVLRNDGEGNFTPDLRLKMLAGGQLLSADLSGNGSPDIINFGFNAMSILLNQGDGTFNTQPSFLMSPDATADDIITVDVDGDGHLDLITFYESLNTVAVRRYQQNGSYGPAEGYRVGELPKSLVAVDLDGNGYVDLITANSGDGTVSILRNLGDGKFADAVDHAVSESPSFVTAADMNGDGLADLIVADRTNHTVSVLLNLGGGAFASPTTDTVGESPDSVVVADLDRDGHLDLITVNFESNSISVLLNTGDGTFAPHMEYAVGLGPVSVHLADFNGDGYIDLVTANAAWLRFGYANSVTVLLNRGDGSFEPRVNYVVGEAPRILAVADLDGDGHVDLLTGSRHDGTVTVLRNQGDGTFITQSTHELVPNAEYDLPGSTIAATDFDGDGHLDLVALSPHSSGSYAYATVARNQGDGTFSPLIRYQIHTVTSQNISFNGFRGTLKLADLNGDGHVEILSVEQTSSSNDGSSLSIMWNRGDGTLLAPAILPIGNSVAAVTAADIDGDGHIDMLTRDLGGVSLLRNLGDGTFAPATLSVAVPGLWSSSSVIAADLNGDGQLDIITTDPILDTIIVSRNLGNGTFALPTSYLAGSYPESVAVADLNGDGHPDLIATNFQDNSVSVFENLGDGTFVPWGTYGTDDFPRHVIAVDIDGDGHLDLVTANDPNGANGGGSISILRNLGDGTFSPQVTHATGNNPRYVAAADFDGDGHLDLVLANAGSWSAGYRGTVSVLRNLGDGTFLPEEVYEVGLGPHSVTVADINGDGHPDIFVPNYAHNSVSLLLNQGDGTFAQQRVFAAGTNPTAAVVADLTGDGFLDLAIANEMDRNVMFLRNLAGPMAIVEPPCHDLTFPTGTSGNSSNIGVQFLTSMFSTSEPTTVAVRVVALEAGKLDAWLDFNRDSDWLDDGEQILQSVDVSQGENLLSFQVPANASIGNVFARFRLSNEGGLTPTGSACEGEVADYQILIQDGTSSAVVASQVVDGKVSIFQEGTDKVIRSGETELFRGPFANITGLQVDGADHDDRIELDISGNYSMMTDGVSINGHGGANVLRLTGSGPLDLTSQFFNIQNIARVEFSAEHDHEVKVASATISALAPEQSSVVFVFGFTQQLTVTDANQWRLVPRDLEDTSRMTAIHQTDGTQIDVITSNPLSNFLQPADVDNSGESSPLDALIILTTLGREYRRQGGGIAIAVESLLPNDETYYVDVNRDGIITPLDALLVLTQIAHQRREGLGEQVEVVVPMILAEVTRRDFQMAQVASGPEDLAVAQTLAVDGVFDNFSDSHQQGSLHQIPTVTSRPVNDSQEWTTLVDSALESLTLNEFEEVSN